MPGYPPLLPLEPFQDLLTSIISLLLFSFDPLLSDLEEPLVLSRVAVGGRRRRDPLDDERSVVHVRDG